jgi:S1-C subfamily serine protease
VDTASATVFGITEEHYRRYRAAKKELSSRYVSRSRPSKALAALNPLGSPKPEHNVVGVGIGEKVSKGMATGILAVKILVRLKFPDPQISDEDRLPSTIHDLPVDVERVGTFRRFEGPPDPRQRVRPARPGSSIGFQDPANALVIAGTFGGLVTDGETQYILSNNHVLADENNLPIGSPIFQPGLLDGGQVPDDRIASLANFIPLSPVDVNIVDCALAAADSADLVSNDILFIGPPTGAADAAIGMEVHKFGRTTGYTAGRITSVDTDVTVGYEIGTLTFFNQIIIVGHNAQPFSAAGDSGSLILERSTNRAVGLLFAGSSSHTLANHIGDVLNAFGGVTLA